jgi:hypothetical protein
MQCHCPNLNSVRAPHEATSPIANTKAKPVIRCEAVLLLQPWSTAVTQTKNSAMAKPARIFRSMKSSKSTQECFDCAAT